VLLCSCTSSESDPHSLCSYLVLNSALGIAVIIFVNRRYSSGFPVGSVLFICDSLSLTQCVQCCHREWVMSIFLVLFLIILVKSISFGSKLKNSQLLLHCAVLNSSVYSSVRQWSRNPFLSFGRAFQISFVFFLMCSFPMNVSWGEITVSAIGCKTCYRAPILFHDWNKCNIIVKLHMNHGHLKIKWMVVISQIKNLWVEDITHMLIKVFRSHLTFRPLFPSNMTSLLKQMLVFFQIC
jgi:hypothetical protein